MLSGVVGTKLRPSKACLMFVIALLFIVYAVLGTFYHLQSLGADFIDNYDCTPATCFALIGFLYVAGIRQHVDFFTSSLISKANRFPVRVLAHMLTWSIVASVSYKLNHAIWYIGVGWIFYNIATVCLFFVLFVAFVLPSVSKSVVVVDNDSDGSEVSSNSSTSRSSSTQTDGDLSTDVTMENVLIA